MTRCLRRRTVKVSFLIWFAAQVDSFSIPTNTIRQKVQCRAAESDATMSTALCVIPPDWDTIQRARHMTRDRTYHRWPPAIRLFHPFSPRSNLSNVALEVARIVEEYEIEPFQVVLDTWTVLPHMEAIEADWEAMRQLPEQEHVNVDVKKKKTKVDHLIAREERLGKERLIKRSKRIRAKEERENATEGKSSSKPPKEADGEDEEKVQKQSPRELLEKQKRMYEEFNGPCVLCLEPDEESRERLVQLRELLRAELFDAYDKYSPSSSVSTTDTLPRAVAEMEETVFRPVVPIGNFPTVTSAVEMARKLKGLWDPLPFNVTDFHLISYESEVSSDKEREDFSDNAEYNLKKTSWLKEDREEEMLTTQGQFGCDALVMLMGEELDVDQESSQEMVDFIMSQGSPGGYDLMEKDSQDVSLGASLDSAKLDDEDDMGNLEDWLDSDDEYDEGTVVVIGRTHFFTGEMRIYEG